MINVAKDVSLVSCGEGSWELFFSIASAAAQAAEICTPAGSNKFYRDGQTDFYDQNVYDDPIGILSNERDYPAYAYTHYADYPAFHGVGDNDSLPGLEGVWSTDASAASTYPSTGVDSAAWSGIQNAKQEDETWASIQPSSVENSGGFFDDWAGTEYIVLSGYGFDIPLDATILSIVAAIKGYSYFSLDLTSFSGYGYGNGGGVFNAGLMLNGVLYPFADPSTVVPYGHPPQTVHAQPPWPNDPGTQYSNGTPVSSGVWTQARSLNWPKVIDPSWYPTPNPNVARPPTPSQVNVGIKPLILAQAVIVSEGPLFCGDLIGCPRTFGHNGPVQKNMNLTPTKQVWTPAEVNDPSFGAALSAWNYAINDATDVTQGYMFLNCIGIGVYYIPGAGGGDDGGGDNPLSKRPRVWIST